MRAAVTIALASLMILGAVPAFVAWLLLVVVAFRLSAVLGVTLLLGPAIIYGVVTRKKRRR